MNALYQCDWPTGKFVNQGSWVISGDAPSVNSETGLATLLLGDTAGYRVYYHDDDMAVNEISYQQSKGWHYLQVVSPDHPATSAIHAAFAGDGNSDAANISVAIPWDSENIEMASLNSDEPSTWNISELSPLHTHEQKQASNTR